jgi:hypothetical protein
MSKNINVYFHVCLKNDGLIIASELLHSLAMSTLLYRAKKINVGIKYEDEKELKQFRKMIIHHNLMGNINILYEEPNSLNDNQELSTAIHFKKYADSLDEDEYVLYFHTKGIGHYETSAENCVRYWRHYMEYFLIQHWKSCVEKLNSGYESVGTFKYNISHMQEYLKFWTDSPIQDIEYGTDKWFYPGTFFWMNTSLIKKIPEKYFYNNTEYIRYSIEMLPGFIEHKHFACSTPNPAYFDWYKSVLHPLQYIN